MISQLALGLYPQLYTQPWAIHPAAHAALCAAALGSGGVGLAHDAVVAGMGDGATRGSASAYSVADGVASIPLCGLLVRKYSGLLVCNGVTSTDIFAHAVDDAAARADVDAILIPVDSPGGLVDGVLEAAAAVAGAARAKPVLAYADGMMCSAAYWIGAQAAAVYATQSAEIGSVGVYAAHLDQTRAAELAGLHVEVFRSGAHKGDGIPGTPLSDAARALIQARVDETAAAFRAAVVAARPCVPPAAMDGRTFAPRAAVELGLVDDVTSADFALRDVRRLPLIRAL